MKKLQYIGADSWDRPVYKDESGKLWKDVNLGMDVPELCSSVNNCFDGEPDMPIRDEFEIVNELDIPNEVNKFQYMMLDRLRSDCVTHINRINGITPYSRKIENVKEHIEEMKSLWTELAEKPEWLTWDQILNYEKEMLREEQS